MSSLNAVVLCLVFSSISLVAVSYINRRQTRRRLMQQKLVQMKRRVVELEEISALIEPLIETKSMLIFVLNELVDLITRTRRLDPRSSYLEVNLANAEERLDQLHAHKLKPGIWRMLNSDAAIARARYALNEAGRILRKRQSLGEFTPAELQTYIAELSWARSMVAVITLVGQGHQAVNHGDVLRAFAYYKSAQQVLMQSAPAEERRQQFIRELSEILGNQRKSISLNLMPEADYNPTSTSNNLIKGTSKAEK